MCKNKLASSNSLISIILHVIRGKLRIGRSNFFIQKHFYRLNKWPLHLYKGKLFLSSKTSMPRARRDICRQQQGGNSVLLPLVRKTNLEPYSQTHSQYSPWLRKQNEDCTKQHQPRLCHHRDLSMLEHIIMQILGSLQAIETFKSVYIFLLLLSTSN